MYVCICHGVTEKDIQKAAKNGANSLQDVKQITGASTGCGSCADMALEVLLEAQPKPTPDFLQIIQSGLNIQTQV
ncbi:(2Fe-2S)-binding protein [Marinicella sp. S1101]|uniref:(2Fe-2S)-binding protein n=1 Tax=Marinicella marina TaxID=2996016 RepID=UPI002260C932|nr:(2Fe-2S)-binding protein [Marinicella marina]MCX7552784.1 (2Fe-2S)-binding protein [Marinicella marina]MDJ1139907.1 (2Fe-2S)-binding protein [Marinicella marina]